MVAATEPRSLGAHGIATAGSLHWNLRTPAYYMHALRREEGVLAHGGPLVVDTGSHTGRSAGDKYVVREPGSEDRIWWGSVNQPLDEQHYDDLRDKVAAYLGARELYVVDAFAGADPEHRVAVRVVTSSAYHGLFARTMFIRPSERELAVFEPDAVLLHAPGFERRRRRERRARPGQRCEDREHARRLHARQAVADVLSLLRGPFLPQPPAVYARLLGEKLERHRPSVWLVNTGWTGGPAGEATGCRSRRRWRCCTRRSRAASTACRPGPTPSSASRCRSRCPASTRRSSAPARPGATPTPTTRNARELAGMFRANFAQLGDVDLEVASGGKLL
jgi:Phosphoenolpyruvate carboxykinase